VPSESRVPVAENFSAVLQSNGKIAAVGAFTTSGIHYVGDFTTSVTSLRRAFTTSGIHSNRFTRVTLMEHKTPASTLAPDSMPKHSASRSNTPATFGSAARLL
jgi:hypothetical protein